MLYFSITKQDPEGFYLNWAPGPMGTRMFDYMKQSVLDDPTSSENDIKMWSNMKPFECSYSAGVLFKLLLSPNKLEYNGKHVDLFDVKGNFEEPPVEVPEDESDGSCDESSEKPSKEPCEPEVVNPNQTKEETAEPEHVSQVARSRPASECNLEEPAAEDVEPPVELPSEESSDDSCEEPCEKPSKEAFVEVTGDIAIAN